MFSKKLAAAAAKAVKATEGPKSVATEGPKSVATEGPKSDAFDDLEPTVADIIQALRTMDSADPAKPGTAAASFKGAFEAHGMDEAAPIGDYLDRVAGDAVGWLRSLPGSRSAEWRACKGAMMMLRECPGVADAVGKKLSKMEGALKKAMSNSGINEETARRTAEAYLSKGGDPVAEDDAVDEDAGPVPSDESARVRLRTAISAYCAAKELSGIAAVLDALWTPDSPLESADTLESVFNAVACEDPVALKVFEVLRSS